MPESQSHGNSRAVFSTQTEIHEQLDKLLHRHRSHAFQKPFSTYNQTAYTSAMQAWKAAGSAPLILDSGCGVGLSTRHLASLNPLHFVIGVDQSADRLSRLHQSVPDIKNFITVRADLVDFWRLLHKDGITLDYHYLLYPNPWPKKDQLRRRWHGHAVFPTLLALGGTIECRSNWKIYVDEFAHALTTLTGQATQCENYSIHPFALTPFEEKYHASGHSLWRCQLKIPNSA